MTPVFADDQEAQTLSQSLSEPLVTTTFVFD
jgi:hypothetical protein